ncbi:hypothetical protein FRC08_015722, partial [Ceratobasidium sp. 394]
MSDPTAATTEEPLFDPSLKKRKKKKVIFGEDPLGADGAEEPEAPAAPAPAETTPGPSILKAADTNGEPAAEDKLADEDMNAMFGDIKKKKKKKTEIPLDLDLDEGAPTPVSGDATPAGGDELADFGDIKKKKKKGSKKAAFDLEAFEKELAGSAKPKDGEDDEADGAADETKALDEGDLGEDVFAQPTAGEGGPIVETWHGTDRDYTYPE